MSKTHPNYACPPSWHDSYDFNVDWATVSHPADRKKTRNHTARPKYYKKNARFGDKNQAARSSKRSTRRKFHTSTPNGRTPRRDAPRLPSVSQSQFTFNVDATDGVAICDTYENRHLCSNNPGCTYSAYTVANEVIPPLFSSTQLFQGHADTKPFDCLVATSQVAVPVSSPTHDGKVVVSDNNHGIEGLEQYLRFGNISPMEYNALMVYRALIAQSSH
ncbi:hypothetical protein FLAG1_07677 [Fusarium langsethiae]|uniref:Uncharacterized protein n=1 Tax=Fusarium langsethiae TaxID=179993 RepID=A0A0N0DDB7_FUSLA|nr:hypothetical protein FLAG1_07677 [Fusarium langsethiae]